MIEKQDEPINVNEGLPYPVSRADVDILQDRTREKGHHTVNNLMVSAVVILLLQRPQLVYSGGIQPVGSLDSSTVYAVLEDEIFEGHRNVSIHKA